MTIQWWRSWHGAPMDSKWPVIAARAGVKVGVVSAVAWALMDYASQHKQRGSIKGFDAEVYAVYSGFPESEINAVIQAMTDKSIIVDGFFSKWDERQPKREDDSKERVKKFREKHNVTQCNADVTNSSVSVSDSSSLNLEGNEPIETEKVGEWLNEESAITKLSKQFEVSAQITAWDLERWNEAIVEMFHGGVSPELLGKVVFEMRNPPPKQRKLTITGPWSCKGIAIGKAAELRAAGIVQNAETTDAGGGFYG